MLLNGPGSATRASARCRWRRLARAAEPWPRPRRDDSLWRGLL